MIKQLVTKVFGSKFERDVRSIEPIVEDILRHEKVLVDLGDEELKAQTDKFRAVVRERTDVAAIGTITRKSGGEGLENSAFR